MLSINSCRLLFQIENNGLYNIRNYNVSHEREGQSVISLIEFKVTNSMFRKGYPLHLRCVASISDVYRKSVDIEIFEDTPRIASITGESPPYGHRKYSTLLCTDLPLNGKK